MEDIVCSGCALLCNDVSAETSGASINSLGLCKLGHTHLETSFKHKIGNTEKELSKVVEVLTSSDSLLVYGWLHTTNEAIQQGQKIASALKADFATGADMGPLQTMSHPIHSNNLEIDLEYVRNNAEFIIYWGADPSESLHRHASRFAVLPRGKNIPEGIESRTIGVVDVRRTETMKMANHRLILPKGTDAELLKTITGELQGNSMIKDKVLGITASELIGFVKGFKKSDRIVIFYGSGLINSGNLNESLTSMATLVQTLRDAGKEAFALPMFVQSNTMGAINASKEKSVTNTLQRLVSNEFDTVLVVGDDVLAHLPGPAAKAMAKTKIVYIGPPGGLTDKKATIAIHAADTMIASDGSMTRIDMNDIEFKKWKATKSEDSISEVLTKLHELLDKKKV